jgi:hypothetical protein
MKGYVGIAQSKEQGVISQLRHTNQHDTIPISVDRTSLFFPVASVVQAGIG